MKGLNYFVNITDHCGIKMFKKNKWYDKIVEKKYNTRDKMYKQFETSIRNAKIDGYSREEMRMLFIGHANVHPTGMYNLPLQLMWLDKYWGEIE